MKKFKYQSKNDRVQISIEFYSFKEIMNKAKKETRKVRRLVKNKKLPRIIEIKKK